MNEKENVSTQRREDAKFIPLELTQFGNNDLKSPTFSFDHFFTVEIERPLQNKSIKKSSEKILKLLKTKPRISAKGSHWKVIEKE